MQRLLFVLLWSYVACAAMAAEPGLFEMRAVVPPATAGATEFSLPPRHGQVQKVWLGEEALLTRSDVASAEMEGEGDQRGLLIKFTPLGRAKFAEVTRNLQGKQLGIVVDGRLRSTPSINEPILGGSAVITGIGIDELADLVPKLTAPAK